MFKKKILLCLFGLIAILSLIMITIKVMYPSYNNIYGSWYIDNTIYIFNRNKQGTLNVNNESYLFNYSVENNKVCLDFENEKLEDKCYTYTNKDSKLTLKDESNTFILSPKK